MVNVPNDNVSARMLLMRCSGGLVTQRLCTVSLVNTPYLA